MVQKNPFVIPILEILKQAEAELGEYDIIQQLEQQGFEFPVQDDSYEMTMFKKHFITMNALYQLQQELFEDGYYLSITAVRVSLLAIHDQAGRLPAVDEGEAKLRDYYLDWSHFDKTSQQHVEQLLTSFWEKYFAIDRQQQALGILGLSEDSSWQDIQRRYRQLAGRHHPDRGGDHARFIEVREAFEVLRACYG